MSRRAPEERAIYFVLVLAGAGPLVGSLGRGDAVGGGLTVCLLMVVVGMVGLVAKH